MRPLKLNMNAFGPYANNEEIDFTKLNGRNIFLITGPTGAGKTTIFDGISYAIYGEASGQDRDGESLRSQFANIDTLTSVELEFELKGKKYYIKRIPKQQKKKVRGEGFSEQKTDAEMKIYVSEEDVKTITGVSNVNEKIYEIMGINYEQFKQIMMIPQGEFRKLLVSESKEREKILQKIFGTEAYKMVELKLIDMAKEIRKSINELNNKQGEIINTIQYAHNLLLEELIKSDNKNVPEIIIALQECIHEDSKNREAVERDIDEKNQLMQVKQKVIFEARENNKKFEEKQEIETQKNILESQKEHIHKENERLLRARKAAKITGTEENHIEKNKNVLQKNQQLKDNAKAIERSMLDLTNAEKELNFQNSKEGERKKISEQITILKSYVEKVKSFEDKKNVIKQIEVQLKNIEESKKSEKQLLDKLKDKNNILADKLEKARKASANYIKTSSQLDKKTQIYNKVFNLDIENKKLVQIRNEYLKYKASANEHRREFDKIESQYKAMEQLFREGQAALLAKDLQEGKACPVCGSLHHPKIASLEDSVPTEEELKQKKKIMDEAKKRFEASDEKYREADVKGRAQSNIVNRIKKEISELINENLSLLEKDALTKFIENKLHELEKSKESLSLELKVLEKEKNEEENIIKNSNKNKIILENEEKVFEKLNNDYTLKLVEFEREKGTLKQITLEIPEKLRSQKALMESINSTENHSKHMEKLLKEAQESYNSCKLQYEKLITERETITVGLKEAEICLNDIENKLKEEISKAGFEDIEDYKNAKLTQEQEESLSKNIIDFNEQLRSIEDRYEKISKDILGLQPINIEELLQQYENIKLEKEALELSKVSICTKIEINNNALLRIKELYKMITDREMEYNTVGDLAEAAKGNNSERMTFERYVLAAFFDDIIDAANIRLAKMSENRYELDRIKEKGKGLTQSGLELQVFDNYTGKYRHVKTLSGGESFKASLSLALGMADVVQCFSGGISLDTIFIDEGFGTLDLESLDNAIQCLIELQNNGRLVGIISHVPELKERIDARLEIIPSAEGSITKFNIL